jgi:integrase
MDRRLYRLKAAQIPRLPPGFYHDGGGLYLIVGKGTARSWIFRFRRDGKLRDHGLGPALSVSLQLARQKAAECRIALQIGNNPVEIRQTKRLERVAAAAKRVTFEQVAERCVAALAPAWRDPKQERQWRQSLAAYVLPTLGKMPVQAVDTALVLQVLEPIWLTKTETATRVRGRIEQIIDYARTRKWYVGENPARWKGHLATTLAKPGKVRKRKPRVALPFAELPAFMTALRQQEAIPARALDFAILTALRTDEVREARKVEIDRAARCWTIPAERMKGDAEHRVPLSDAAMAIVEAMFALDAGEYLFPGRDGGRRPFGPAEMRRVVAKLGAAVDVHGFRAAFRTWAADETHHAREVCEVALAHKVGDDTENAYQRGDLFEKRRALMEDWARYCAGGGEVVPFPVEARA